MDKMYRFVILDEMNPWAASIEVRADGEAEARARASSYLFSRRTVGSSEDPTEGLVHLELM